MEHPRLPCLHPLGSKLLTHCSDCQNSRCFHILTQNWFTSEFLQHGKKIVNFKKSNLGTRQTKIIPLLKNSNLDTIQCGCNSRHSNEHLGGLTYVEVASLRSWQAALVDSGTLGLFLESRGRELAISILNPWGTASWVLITPRAT